MNIQYEEGHSESFALGGSIYGGRPTFALVRDEDADEISLTLYELLPTEQANARLRRLERRRQRISNAQPFADVISDDVDGTGEWTWEEWVAVKVRQVSGARLRSLLQLVDEVLRETDNEPSIITGTGNATLLLREEAGIRLSLGFIGVKPLQRVDRMRALSRGVARMSLEECYYWHAKCRSPKSPSGAKALRTLLTEHK